MKSQESLQKLMKGRNTPQKVVLRAKIALMLEEGIPKKQIAEVLKISRTTVYLWTERYRAGGIEALLKDAPRPGRIPAITEETEKAVIEATLHTIPYTATHWSVRTMARAQNLSRMAVQRIWKKYNIQPHRIKTFKLSNDPRFIDKVKDVVGLYLNPPEKALVLSVDEKSQIQALDRTQPGLPLKRGYAGTMTHDYKRHGTTTLFAALNIMDGTVIGSCMSKHRQDEFLKFLKKSIPKHHLISTSISLSIITVPIKQNGYRNGLQNIVVFTSTLPPHRRLSTVCIWNNRHPW